MFLNVLPDVRADPVPLIGWQSERHLNVFFLGRLS